VPVAQPDRAPAF